MNVVYLLLYFSLQHIDCGFLKINMTYNAVSTCSEGIYDCNATGFECDQVSAILLLKAIIDKPCKCTINIDGPAQFEAYRWMPGWTRFYGPSDMEQFKVTVINTSVLINDSENNFNRNIQLNVSDNGTGKFICKALNNDVIGEISPTILSPQNPIDGNTKNTEDGISSSISPTHPTKSDTKTSQNPINSNTKNTKGGINSSISPTHPTKSDSHKFPVIIAVVIIIIICIVFVIAIIIIVLIVRKRTSNAGNNNAAKSQNTAQYTSVSQAGNASNIKQDIVVLSQDNDGLDTVEYADVNMKLLAPKEDLEVIKEDDLEDPAHDEQLNYAQLAFHDNPNSRLNNNKGKDMV